MRFLKHKLFSNINKLFPFLHLWQLWVLCHKHQPQDQEVTGSCVFCNLIDLPKLTTAKQDATHMTSVLFRTASGLVIAKQPIIKWFRGFSSERSKAKCTVNFCLGRKQGNTLTVWSDPDLKQRVLLRATYVDKKIWFEIFYKLICNTVKLGMRKETTEW